MTGETEKKEYHSLEADRVVEHLATDAGKGISQAEADIRIRQYGPNRLQVVKRDHWYQIFLRQFTDVLIAILLVAAAIAFSIGETGDAITILIIVILNGILGFVQEFKAEKAIAALKHMLSPKCTVLRDGKQSEIDSTLLVPGDIVLLQIGDRVPADIRLVEAVNLKADESALTGESLSVHKDTEVVAADAPLASRRSMAWMGTTITNGLARGVVVNTGMQTEFGYIAELTQSVGEAMTPLQHKLAVLGKQLGMISVFIAVLVSVAGVFSGKPVVEMFMTGISLAVAVVPEGLPAVVTITLALGVRSMVRRRALLRRLQAAETLGSATVICTDKTGTLTKNEMTVRKIWLPSGVIDVTGSGYDPKGHFEIDGSKIDYHQHHDLLQLLKTGIRCNHARVSQVDGQWHEYGEPTEAALIVAAYKAWLSVDGENNTLTEFSFNSTRKRMTVIEQHGNAKTAYVKGAPEIILARCTHIQDDDVIRELTEGDHELIAAAYNAMAADGLRILALAIRELPEKIKLDENDVENKLTFQGCVGIIDPPRPEVPEAIKVAGQAGIRTIMITGDAPATALAIARRIGLNARHAMTGNDLNQLDSRELRKILKQGETVFARTTPQHKLRIVTALQKQGHVVGMTGDGVNDAPALKKADIGIAMGIRGTDVAKGAADMILTDDNFASIISAVEEGRRQYDNIQKFVRYLLSSNTGEVIAIFVNILLGGPLILLPVQILWMNLVTDGMTAVALGMEPAEKGVMNRPPLSSRHRVLDRHGLLMIALLGGYIGIVTLLIFQYYLASGTTNALLTAHTVAFTSIIILEKMNVFNYRALHAPMSAIGFLTNPWVIGAWLVTVALQVCAVYVPFLQSALHTVALGLTDWLIIIAISLPLFLLTEIWKRISWKRQTSAVR